MSTEQTNPDLESPEIVTDFDTDVPTVRHKSYEVTISTPSGHTLDLFIEGAGMGAIEHKVKNLFGAGIRIVNIDVCVA